MKGQELEKKYFTRKEVANYFWISIPSLVMLIYKNWLKETIMTWKEGWGNKIIRISKDVINKLELKLNK